MLKITRISGVEVLEIDGIVDDATVSAISLTGNPLNYQPQTLNFTETDAAPIIIDSALPDDNITSQDGYGLIARSISGTGNVGARDFGKSSDGETYEYLDTSQGEPIYRLIDALGDVANSAVMDNGNTITIREDSRLSSLNLEEMGEAPFVNLAFIQAGSFWELVQFQTVTDNMDGTMTLSGLLRGRRGTEHLTGLHADNDRLVILTDGYVRGGDLTDLGQLRYFIATLGEDDDGFVTQHTPTLEALRPYSVTDIQADNSTGTVNFTWKRRTRIGGAAIDGQDVPLSETSESYDIDIYDDTPTLVASYNSTSEAFTYSDAQQAADLGANYTYFDAEIFQVSAEYGRGAVNTIRVNNGNDFGKVALLMGFEGADGSTSFDDESLNDWVISTSGTPTIETDEFEIGTSSLYLDGSSYLTVPHDTSLSVANSDDITMECYIWPIDFATTRTILNKRDGGSAEEFTFNLESGTGILKITTFVSGSAGSSVSSLAALSANTWTHVAAVRKSGTWELFVDGVSQGTDAETATPSSNGSALKIGHSGFNSSRKFYGYIDELRIRNDAVYTSNFTPPSSAFPRS